MKLLITIDTEEDNAWSGNPGVSTENVTCLRRFQEVAARHGMKPTWLCTHTVLADPRLAEALGPAVSSGTAEIGTHLHPWNCPPFPEGIPADPGEQYYATEIAASDFEAKMRCIVESIRAQFGVDPSSYRAGRWGFDARQIPALLSLGIRIDCSVTPHTSWHEHRGRRTGAGGPDFRSAPHHPYWLDSSDVRREGNSGLLELPMTILYARGPFRDRRAFWPVVDRCRYTPFGKLLQRSGWTATTFRPRGETGLPELLDVWRAAKDEGLPYVMLMFHSSELLPGGSPYYQDANAVERLYEVLETLFSELQRAGVRGNTLAEFAASYLASAASRQVGNA